MDLRSVAKKLPGLRRLAKQPPPFNGSTPYWVDRYATDGTSGAGSYGRLAEFKAGFLNRWIKEERLTSVIEFGCGNGAQIELSDYPSYVGFDPAWRAVEQARKSIEGRSNYRIEDAGAPCTIDADVTLSLDVIYHLVEDEVFDAHMRQLFKHARKQVIIYSSNFDDQTAPHVRHRKFTDWIAREMPQADLIGREFNPYPFDKRDTENTSHADFWIYRPKKLVSKPRVRKTRAKSGHGQV